MKAHLLHVLHRISGTFPLHRPSIFQPRGRALLVLAAVSVSFGQMRADQSWVGNVGNYNDGSNWTGGVVPSGYESIVIDNGGTAQSAGGNAAESVSVGGSSTLEILAGQNSEFQVSGDFHLGSSGVGTVSIGSQADLETGDFYGGFVPGSTGVVNMSGGYLSSFATYIGYAGSATFTLEEGSTLQSTTGFVGYLAGSQGVVHINDSTWKAEDQSRPVDLTVGVNGSGEIQSVDSTISALNLVLGNGSSASGTVSFSGGELTIEEVIQVGNAGEGELTLSGSSTTESAGLSIGVLANSTGKVSITSSFLTSSANVFVGLGGDGTLETQSADFEAPELFVGKESGSTGTAIVSGGDMALTGELHVGAEGRGTFTLQGGGILHTDKGNMGYATGAVGEINILDGTWENTQAIFVGVSGSGTLNVGADGEITSESGYIAQDADGEGTVNITGGSWEMSNTLAVGVNGSGEISVTEGGVVSSEWAQIGLHAGASGVATVDNGSWTTTKTLTIGDAGDGELHVTNGGQVSAATIEMAATDGVKGVLTVTDSTLTTENLIAITDDASVEFSGAQLKLLGGSQVEDTLLIEGFAAGAVVIGADGLTVDTQGGNAQISSALSGVGSLTKTGAGRLRLNTANSFAGGAIIEEGVLEIANNASLGTAGTRIGTGELRAIADITLAGTGSGSPASLTISSGQTATFSATTGQTLTLSTADFVVESGASISFGSAGNAGAVVFAPDDLTTPSNVSQVTVQAGSAVAGNGRLEQLTALADSTTVAAGATLDYQDNLTGGGIKALFGAGTVNMGTQSTTSLTVGAGNFSGDIAGNGALVKETTGTLILSGQNSFIGGTTVNAGALIVDGSLSFGFGQVDVNSGGTLGGDGIVGTIHLSGGTLTPGSAAGNTLTAQSLYWDTGVLLFDLGPNSAASDLLDVGGLEGFGTTYSFTFLDQGWVVGSTYTLISFTASDIDISDFRFTNDGGFAGDFSYNGNSLEFTLTAVPEPSTVLLAVGAVALLALQKFRRHRSGRRFVA